MDFSTATICLGIASALLVGLSKTGVPGVSIAAVLLMAEAFPGMEKASVSAILPVLLIGDLFAVLFYRQYTQWGNLAKLLPCVVIGMVPGALVLSKVDHEQFRTILGVLVLGLLVLEGCRQRFGWNTMPHRWWFVAGMGVLAGFGTIMGNAAGPIMGIYLISLGMQKEQFMGTWAWFFLIVNTTKIPIFSSMEMFSATTLSFGFLLIPLVMLGAFLGKRVFQVIPQKLFDPLILALAMVAALRLVGIEQWF